MFTPGIIVYEPVQIRLVGMLKEQAIDVCSCGCSEMVMPEMALLNCVKLRSCWNIGLNSYDNV